MTYIVIDAPGYCGDFARIYARCDTLHAAVGAALPFGPQRVVVDDGGWADNHQVGMHILSVDAARYERHWTMADTERRRAERQCEKERAAAIKAAKAAIPKGLRPGTPSYIDAMDAALQRRGF